MLNINMHVKVDNYIIKLVLWNSMHGNAIKMYVAIQYANYVCTVPLNFSMEIELLCCSKSYMLLDLRTVRISTAPTGGSGSS